MLPQVNFQLRPSRLVHLRILAKQKVIILALKGVIDNLCFTDALEN